MKIHYRLLIFLVALSIVWIGAFMFLRSGEGKFHGDEFSRPDFDFSLTDQNNEKFTLSDQKGKVLLLNFGFTNCPDVCPATLGVLTEVLNVLEEEDRVAALFITVDPERDTVARLAGYIPFFHNRIIGLTGTHEAIKKISSAYGVFYLKEENTAKGAEDDYEVAHSPAVYLINTRGKMVLRYPADKLNPEKIAEDIERLL